MAKRFFTSFVLLLFVFSPFSFAEDEVFQEGKHYEVLPQAIFSSEHQQNGNVDVFEFFSYACPVCYMYEEPVQNWLAQQKDINFQRVPVVYHKGWEIFQRAYYVAVALGIEPKLSPALFEAIHSSQQKFEDPAAMENFFEQFDIKSDDFYQAYNQSPLIDARVSDGENLTQQMRVYSVPTFVIAGKYKTSPSNVQGDDEKLFEVINFLIQKSQAQKNGEE